MDNKNKKIYKDSKNNDKEDNTDHDIPELDFSGESYTNSGTKGGVSQNKDTDIEDYEVDDTDAEDEFIPGRVNDDDELEDIDDK
jgi:hypothetical protein